MSEPKTAVQDMPFEPAKSEEIVPILQSAILRKSKLQCWSSGQKYSYTSRIVRLNEGAGLKAISVSKETSGGDEFEAVLIREGIEEIHFSLHLPTDIIFFKGELRRGDSDTFTVRIKEPIYKVQRRRSIRLPIPSTTVIPVSFRLAADASNYFDAQLLNISDGGASLMSGDPALFRILVKDVKIAQMAFKVGGIEVAAAGIIRHTMELGNPGMKNRYRYGVEFTAIDPKLRDRLARYVLEESAKFIGRR